MTTAIIIMGDVMKTAIDRLGVGTEVEVCADDFRNEFVPNKTERFFCTECGESVTLIRGTKQTNHFRHHQKTARSMDCDRRVDGLAGMSYYQRVGLPLYLRRIGTDFQLNLGFPALGDRLLDEAMRNNLSIRIVSKNDKREIKVNYTNFISDSLTLHPVDFVPIDDKYSIFFLWERYISGIKKKWAEIADGFTNKGAIFNYGSVGKKIRCNDSICTNRKYLFVVNGEIKQAHIKKEFLGILLLKQKKYNVYVAEVNVDDNECEFRDVERYLHDMFSVWLVKNPSEIIPLWPPMVERDVYIPSRNGKVYCGIMSGNETPRVFICGKYTEGTVDEIEIDRNCRGMNIVEFCTRNHPIGLAADRKYTGREKFFQYKKINNSEIIYVNDIRLADGERNINNLNNKCDFDKGIQIISNAKMELCIGNKFHKYMEYHIRGEITNIPSFDYLNDIILMVEGNIILRYNNLCPRLIKRNENKKTKYDIERIIRSCRGEMVPMPMWVQYVLRKTKKNNEDVLYNTILKTIKYDNIYIAALKEILKFKKINME